MAFPGFVNGRCLRDTHVDMHMRRNTSVHLHWHNFRSFTHSNPACFAVLSIASSPCASVPGTWGRKQCVLRSCPCAWHMLINGGQGGCSNTQITPLDTLQYIQVGELQHHHYDNLHTCMPPDSLARPDVPGVTNLGL